jgi:formylglycine-generating enzyme required for sulfatase activity
MNQGFLSRAFVLAAGVALVCTASPGQIPSQGKDFKVPVASGIQMLWVAPGTFQMGSPPEESIGKYSFPRDETLHKVTLTKGFWLGKYEVTQEQYSAIIKENRSDFKGAQNPAERVSWYWANQFCLELNKLETEAGRIPNGYEYSLPTEAQWEYACRAGTTTAWYTGNPITPKEANIGKVIGKTTTVGNYPPNPWGFHDMYGNVGEWCRDRFADYPDHHLVDPEGPGTGKERMHRGGGWMPGHLPRSAMRFPDRESFSNNQVGFRLCLRPVKQSPKPEPGKNWTIPMEDWIDLVWINPGSFIMGSPETEPGREDDESQHKVTLEKGYWIGKFEVTQAQYEALAGKNPSYFQGKGLPVEKVSWDDATEFCGILTIQEEKAGRIPEGYRYALPTEAQWEYACRAGSKSAFTWGTELGYGQANFGMEVSKTAKMGTYPPNKWGLHGMHGNVQEWCQDWYGQMQPNGFSVSPGAKAGRYRVAKGGSWAGDVSICRSANRGKRVPVTRSNLIGFRVCLGWNGD